MSFYAKRITKPKNKTEASTIHALKRAKERFDWELTKADLKKIRTQIQNGDSIPLKKSSNRVHVHIVTYNGVQLKVAYDKIRKVIVTLMEYTGEKEEENALKMHENTPKYP
jgi:hypothetical protein